LQNIVPVLAMSRTNFMGYGTIMIHIHCTRTAKGISGGMKSNG